LRFHRRGAFSYGLFAGRNRTGRLATFGCGWQPVSVVSPASANLIPRPRFNRTPSNIHVTGEVFRSGGARFEETHFENNRRNFPGSDGELSLPGFGSASPSGFFPQFSKRLRAVQIIFRPLRRWTSCQTAREECCRMGWMPRHASGLFVWGPSEGRRGKGFLATDAQLLGNH